MDFLDGIYVDIENGVVSGVLSLDLKKAFDCLEDDLLLTKLKMYGLTDLTSHGSDHTYVTDVKLVR